jgi:signal transduction histidine kinase
MHDKVFELYFTTKKEGSGIGLAQTFQILEWHYGSVDFESAETTGTIFRFQIPIAGAATEITADYAADVATHSAEIESSGH